MAVALMLGVAPSVVANDVVRQTGAPPERFNAGAQLVSGQIFGFDGGANAVFTSRVDGTQTHVWTTDPRAQFEADLPDGALWVVRGSDRQHGFTPTRLYVSRIGRGTRLLANDAGSVDVAWAARAVFVSRTDHRGRDAGFWEYFLDGRAPQRVAAPDARTVGLSLLSTTVSPNGRAWARTFATGDLDMGGTDWLTQVGIGTTIRYEPFHRTYAITRDDQLYYAPDRDHVWTENLVSGRRAPSAANTIPSNSPNGRFAVSGRRGVLEVRDLATGSVRSWPIPGLRYGPLAITPAGGAIFEEQENRADLPAGGRHVVVDLLTGRYAVFDPLDPLRAAAVPEPILGGATRSRME